MIYGAGMPIFDYGCAECGFLQEDVVFLSGEPVPAQMVCPVCTKNAQQLVPLIARTDKSWGETHAHFDRGLGSMVKNRQDRERIARKKGLVPLEDMPRHYWEDSTQTRKTVLQKQDDVMHRYQAALKKHNGDKIKAIPEAMPARQCLDGSLSTTFSE